MKFFDWTTDYQIYCKQVPKKNRRSYDEFLPNRINDLKEVGAAPVRVTVEHVWEREGRPYYNIHPKIAPKLCKVDLTKIPSNLFQMPHGQVVLNVRFAQQHEDFTFYEELVTDNIAASGSKERGVLPSGSYCRGFLMIDNRNISWGNLKQDWLGDSGKGMILFLMDFGVSTSHDQPIYCVYGIRPEEGVSLEEALRQGRATEGRLSYDAMISNILRLAVTIGFLSDNPTICEHDVLSKDRSNFDGADEDQRKVIIERAKRRGKNGYNIGSDLMFLGERPLGERRSAEATGRELEYAHIRGGHPHAVRYGKGRKLVKIKWYAPTTVRDDLPFKLE